MAQYDVRKILVSHLELNTENPRFEVAADESEAVKIMLMDQFDKIFKLAGDIVSDGLNPSELTIVSPLKSASGRFVVLEGNRRITALKLLSNPNLAKVYSSTVAKKFESLCRDYKEIRKISCVVFENPEEAQKWIRLKHTGENDGVGTVRWDAQQVARFEESTGGSSVVALQAIDFLKNSADVDGDLKKELHKIPLTNLDRLVTDKNVQELLGISIKGNRLQAQVDEAELVKGLKKIATDLISKKIKVKDIYNRKDRENYIETFKKSEIPRKALDAEPWDMASAKKTVSKTSSAKKSIPISTNRKYIIPRDCIISIRNQGRINKIYSELKSLPCEDYPNAAAVLLRVFVELSADVYIEKNGVGKLSKDSKLIQKIEGIALDLETRKIMEKDSLKGIRTMSSNPNHIFSINTFNAYVHNRHLNPIPKDLKTTWDNIQVFIVKIWENV